MNPLLSSSLFARAGNLARFALREAATELASRLTMHLAHEAGIQLREYVERVSTLEELERLRTMLTPEAWALVADIYDVLRTHSGFEPISPFRRRSPLH